MKKILNLKSLTGLGALALAGGIQSASAAGCDPYATLVTAVSFTNVTTDVVTVAAAVVVVLIAIRAIRFILGVVRR